MSDAPDAPDAFTALAAETTAIQPDQRFATTLRQQLIDEIGTTMTTPTAPAPVAAVPATTGDPLEVTNTVTPYLCVNGAAAAIEFYVAAFGAIERHRMVGDDGRIGHAEIIIGGSRLMLADEYPEVGVLSPTTRGGSSTNFTLMVNDVDQTFARALQLGATELLPVADQFYGFRQGTLADPFGHQWSLSAPIAGYTEQQYVERSAAEGYEVVQAATPATPAAGTVDNVGSTGHQSKRHARGDLFYFTLPIADLPRAQAFFGAVLGWQFLSPDNGHIENIAAPPGGLNQTADAGARLWFVVDDIHAAVAKVRELGGTSDDPQLYDSGWSADCTDDQGTVFSLSVPAAKYNT